MNIKKQGIFNQQADRFFGDIRAFGSDTITHALGVDTKIAEQIAGEIAYRLSQHWGGSMFYVTKHSPWLTHERDRQIWQDFNGKNYHELAQRFGLSIPYIYKIVSRMRKLQANPAQIQQTTKKGS
jgi:Mor family transcriptional regulator